MRDIVISKQDGQHNFYLQPGCKYGKRDSERQGLYGDMPLGVPQTVEQALAEIDEGEKEFEQGYTFSHEQVMQTVWTKIHSYAD